MPLSLCSRTVPGSTTSFSFHPTAIINRFNQLLSQWVKFLLVFASTVIPGFSLLEINDLDFYYLWEMSESDSEILYDSRFTANQFVLATGPLRPTTSNFILQLNTWGYSSYVTSFLTRGWVCRLQLLLSSTAQSYSGSSPTVSDLRLPRPGEPGPCIYIPQEQGPCYTPRHWVDSPRNELSVLVT
jgi:hypothetical protein